MEYKTFMPHTDLELFVNCYWTLEIQASDNSTKQRIIPDGLIEMAFILGDDIKRYTSKDSYILQPRAMVLGQTMEPFYIEPTGYVKTFAIRFYPYSLAHLLNIEIKSLANTETPLTTLFGEKDANELERMIIIAKDTEGNKACNRCKYSCILFFYKLFDINNDGFQFPKNKIIYWSLNFLTPTDSKVVLIILKPKKYSHENNLTKPDNHCLIGNLFIHVNFYFLSERKQYAS